MSFLLLFSGFALAEDVVVTSNLEGAAIFLNGKDTGEVTPGTITGVRPGAIQVSVRDGCVSGTANVKVVAGQTAKVSLLAIEQGGSVVVRPTPTDAKVTVDGKIVAKAGQKVSVECGKHTIKAEKDGYASASFTIDVAAEQAIDLPFELKKGALGSLELSVQPRTALLLLDGKEVGTDTVTLPSVATGDHTIGAEYTGYQSVEQTIDVGPGDDIAWHFELVRNATKTKSTATQLRGPPPSDEPDTVDADGGDDEDLDSEDLDSGSEDLDEVPYYLRDEKEKEKAEKEKEKKASSSSSSSKEASSKEASSKASSSSDRSTTKVDKGGNPKTGLRVAGGVMTGLGVVGGVGTVFLYNGANVAHDAWVTKDDAARASGDPELKAKADAYYENQFVPKATLFYAGAGASAAFLATGVILFVVDAPVLPSVVPGGGLLTWHGSF